jgi:hypothetical protein
MILISVLSLVLGISFPFVIKNIFFGKYVFDWFWFRTVLGI